jgi:hypothetical protein
MKQPEIPFSLWIKGPVGNFVAIPSVGVMNRGSETVLINKIIGRKDKCVKK